MILVGHYRKGAMKKQTSITIIFHRIILCITITVILFHKSLPNSHYDCDGDDCRSGL